MIGNVTRQILHLVDEAAEEVDGDGQHWPVVDDEVDADEGQEEEPGDSQDEEYEKVHLLGFFSAKVNVARPTSPLSKGDPVASSHTDPKDSSRSIDQIFSYLWILQWFTSD